jgi:hypothetical protein
MTLTATSPEVLEFIAGVQNIKNEYFAKNLTSLEKPLMVCERGTKFLAVDSICYPSTNTGRSVFCFIAACDGETKGLGAFKKGDIMRAASYKIPAKHSRGNIYDENKGLKNIGPYGPAYLK